MIFKQKGIATLLQVILGEPTDIALPKENETTFVTISEPAFSSSDAPELLANQLG